MLIHIIIYMIARIYESETISRFDQGGKLGFLQESEPGLNGNPFSAAFKYLFVKEKEQRAGLIGKTVRVIITGVYLSVLSYYLNFNFFNER